MIENILGTRVNIRIIRLLHSYPNRSFSYREIGEYTGVKGGNLLRALNRLRKHGILIKDQRKYKINYSHKIAQSLKDLFEIEKQHFQNIDQRELNQLADITNNLMNIYSDIQDIILFGSIARGTYNEKSDMDIMLIKKRISSKIELELARLSRKFERKIQFFLHTPEEFKKSDQPVIKQVKREGINLIDIFKAK